MGLRLGWVVFWPNALPIVVSIEMRIGQFTGSVVLGGNEHQTLV